MALAPGTRIGPYEITAAIGAGGMGEVYRALDTTLDRDVAIKILPDLLASDPDRVARFSREAKTLASLNHTNIAHIHGVVDSPFALVMEFVDGEDLAQRLARGAIPLDEAIPIAKQIADALECAHEQGIVHRDLKPANVKVRPDGAVKVLDFGLAKALSAPAEASSGSIAPILSPTFTSPAMTQMGIILGTAAYMAPEQARGKATDKRADIWAFGVVLFEMLSGTRAFEGSEVSDTLAFVLTKEPDWNALPAEMPLSIHRLLRRCLHKDRKLRLADISDARLELDEALSPSGAEGRIATAVAPRPSLWRRAALPATLLAGALVGGAVVWSVTSRAPVPPQITRFELLLPEGIEFTNIGRNFIDLSRDGSRMVFTAGSQLYVRRLSSFVAEPVPGSPVGAVVGPVFSPDGQSIAFYADNALKRLPVTGGTPFTLVPEMVNPHGLVWTEAGLFAGQGGVGIVRIPEGGGEPQVVAAVEESQSAQGPQLLPDNDTLIFTIHPSTGEQRFEQGVIVAHSLRTGTRKVLYEGGTDGKVMPTGHLVFGVSNVLYAVRFDAATLTVSGTPTPILEGVRRAPAVGAMTYRVASNGTLIFVPGIAMSLGGPRTLGFLDFDAKITPLSIPPNTFESPRLSPDGSRIAVTVSTDAGADIWIQDLPVKSDLRRLTFGGRNRYPVWSPDGKRILFQSNRDGADALYVQDADKSGGVATLLLKGDGKSSLIPSGWSPYDLIVMTNNQADRTIVQILSMRDHKVTTVTPSASGTLSGAPAFSKDGKWLAYSVSLGGAPSTTFVEPIPITGEKIQIGQGGHPAWTPDGTGLLLNARTPTMAFYQISTKPRVAFSLARQVERGGSLAPNAGARWYDFAPDGKRLLVVVPASISTIPNRQINVVLNWLEELKK